MRSHLATPTSAQRSRPWWWLVVAVGILASLSSRAVAAPEPTIEAPAFVTDGAFVKPVLPPIQAPGYESRAGRGGEGYGAQDVLREAAQIASRPAYVNSEDPHAPHQCARRYGRAYQNWLQVYRC